jgi:hypothetical protein
MAEGGTLFLDEVNELAPELQAKLLRVLQEQEFERLSGTRGIPLDTRLIAATNKKLSAAFEAAEFRTDLCYRLNVVTLTKPALRDRAEDIPRRTLSVEGQPEVQDEDEGTVGGGEGLPRQIRLAGKCAGARTRNRTLGAAGIGQSGLPEDLPETALEVGCTSSDEPAKYRR